MEIFVQRLQERARELGLSQVDVARLAGLNERRFNHYARGRRQPDLATLVRIASTLKTTPNWLLGVEAGSTTGPRQRLEAKLNTTCQTLDDFRLGLAVTLITALATHDEPSGDEAIAIKRTKKLR
jgi:transcriptional regulator with XRE-family HTH domain